MTKNKSTDATPPDKQKKPSRKPVAAWRPIDKPKLIIKSGDEARQARAEHENRPITFWGAMIRFLPVWALLVMILILEPALPLRAVQAITNRLGRQESAEVVPEPVEPVFIVEGGQQAPSNSELPLPNWSLEVSPVFEPEIQYWADMIAQWSLLYRVKPNIVATLMQIESCGNPYIVSPATAQGLFQVIPLHFEEGEDAFDPDTNARRGLTYFAEMYAAANGDLGQTFAAYNAGPWAIGASPAEWPAETQNYQFWATGIYEEAEMGLSQSPTLQDWLLAGGETLCTQAADVIKLLQAR